jgi:hypothetical protein
MKSYSRFKNIFHGKKKFQRRDSQEAATAVEKQQKDN